MGDDFLRGHVWEFGVSDGSICIQAGYFVSSDPFFFRSNWARLYVKGRLSARNLGASILGMVKKLSFRIGTNW